MSVIIAGPTTVMLILVASLAPGRRARVALPLATCFVQPEVINCHEVQNAAEIDRGADTSADAAPRKAAAW